MRVGDRDVALFRVRDEVYALGNACPHMGAELHGGQVRVHTLQIECHWHHWKFDLRTGRTQESSWACAETFPVEIRGDEVWLDPRGSGRGRPESSNPDGGGAGGGDDDEWVVWDDAKHLKRKPPRS